MLEVSHPYGKEMQDEFSAKINHSYKVERGMTGLLVHQETQLWQRLQKPKTFEREKITSMFHFVQLHTEPCNLSCSMHTLLPKL